MQLHWWGAPDGQLAMAAATLDVLRRQGMMRALGVTNMDLPHLRVVCAHARVAIAQLSLSLVDRRVLDGGVAAFVAENGIQLVAYGVLCGGFLSEKWLARLTLGSTFCGIDSRSKTPAKLQYEVRVDLLQHGYEYSMFARLATHGNTAFTTKCRA